MSTPSPTLRIETDDLSRPEVIALLQAHSAHMYALSPPESVHTLDLDALRAPDVTFWTAWRQDGGGAGPGTLMGCLAMKALDATHAELKSMRTPDHLRGHGAGRQLLAHALAQARQRGCTRVSLETGPGEGFAAARALYARFGFETCGPFGDYPEDPYSVFMTLRLS